MVCLDSDIVIDLLKEEKNVTKRIISMRNSGIELSTTSINAFELFKGTERTNNEKELEGLMNFLNNVNILDFNLSVSRKAARIFENLRKNGQMLDTLDVMIASICVVNDEPLLTRNTKHFEKISNLILEKL